MTPSNHSHLENPEHVQILGNPILSRLPQDRNAWLDEILRCGKRHLLVTANPEILVQTTQDERYKSIIENADAVVADGFGIVLAGLLRGNRIQRLTGVDLTTELLKIATDRDLPVHFALYGSGLTTLDDLRLRFHGLRMADSHEATIVIANFGAPKQEYWLDEHRKEFPNARILIGVGGALDYLCGKVRRAPRLVQSIGLEWLWRLVRQPKRWKRIWNAVVVFPWKVLTQ